MPGNRRQPALWSATLSVARKELRASFRDRQTAIYTFVLPICLYPVLFWCMIQGALLIQGRREHTSVRLGLSAADEALVPDGFESALRVAGSRLEPAGGEEQGLGGISVPERELEVVEIEPVEPMTGHLAAEGWMRRADPELPDALLHLDSIERARAAERPPASLFYDSTRSRSELARQRVETRVDQVASSLRDAAAQRIGHDPSELVPFEVEARNVAGQADMGAYLLSFLLPVLLVVMSVMGAFFPAVDLTAGERERGSAETTLLLPVPRLAVHQGKILAVCISSVIATALNLFALGLSAGHLLETVAAGTAIRIELPMVAFLAISPLALLFSFAVSAILTGIAALARSFKEGQAMLGPVQLLFIFPAMAGALPGLELTPVTAVVPVVNVVLAFRSLLRGEVLPLELSITALALMLFAVTAIALAVRVLSRESLALSAERLSLRHLLPLLRSTANTR